jgi:hypothetical protein
MGLIIDGQSYDLPDQTIQSFKDDPQFGLKPNDGKKRPKTWIRGIVIHTTKGIPGGKNKTPQKIKPGIGPDSKRDEKVARMWSLDERNAGAHLIVDSDGSWVCTADLATFAAYHAGNVNSVTIGIEIYQQSDAGIYEIQLKNVCVMCDFLTRHFGIQRQFHRPYKRHAIKRGLQRGRDMVGVYGHRDCSNNRGPGDPGDAIFEWLEDCGYEAFDYEENEDKGVWALRQEQLGLLADGVPGPTTVQALKDAGYKHGLWISRPGD